MPKVGIVVLDFALRGSTPEDMRRQEPNPCNIELGIEAARIKELYRDSVMIAQWSSADWLERHNFIVDHVVDLREDGTYLDTQMVWDEAKAYLRENDITSVIMVAQPWLHLHLGYARRLASQDHFNVIKEQTSPIGYDDDERNSQPWTRTKLAFLLYFIKKLFGRKGGHNGRQVASESPA